MLYATTMGRSEQLAKEAYAFIKHTYAGVYNPIVEPINKFELEDLAELPNEMKNVFILISTCQGGTAPESDQSFDDQTRESCTDHRFGKYFLQGRNIHVIGLGGKAYSVKFFCTPAKNLCDWIKKMGADSDLLKIDTEVLGDKSVSGKLTSFLRSKLKSSDEGGS